MARYRKTALVEATQWHKHGDHAAVFPYSQPKVAENPDLESQGFVNTLEGPLNVQPGDWILTGVKGENWAVKPDIFEETYELVEEDA
jgi:hypothetical protein